MAAPIQNGNNKKNTNTEIDGLYGYISYLRQSIAKTAETIKKEENITRQTIFNVASYFGIPSLQSRDKITENMAEAGVILIDEDCKTPRNEGKTGSKERQKDKKKERERRRKIRLEEEMQKFCELKKKQKMSPPEFEEPKPITKQ